MIAPLIMCIFGLAGFAGFSGMRVWETRRGERVASPFRTRLDQWVTAVYQYLTNGDIATHYRIRFLALLHAGMHQAVLGMLALIKIAERFLASLSHRMRTTAPKVTAREPSAFLKTITPDKRPDPGTPGAV